MLFDIVDIGKGCAGGGLVWFAGFRSYDRLVHPGAKVNTKALVQGRFLVDALVRECGLVAIST